MNNIHINMTTIDLSEITENTNQFNLSAPPDEIVEQTPRTLVRNQTIREIEERDKAAQAERNKKSKSTLNPFSKIFIPKNHNYTQSFSGGDTSSISDLFKRKKFGPYFYGPDDILITNDEYETKYGAVSKDLSDKLKADDELKDVMKRANLLHRPTEEMDVEAVIYFEERKESTLLHYKETIQAHTDELEEASRIAQIEWQDMYRQITEAEEKEKTKMPTEQKEKICGLVMQLKYNIEKEKIDLRYPALKPIEEKPIESN